MTMTTITRCDLSVLTAERLTYNGRNAPGGRRLLRIDFCVTPLFSFV